MRSEKAPRRIKLTRSQKIAYHEAAHVVAHLRFEIAFRAVYLARDDGTIALTDGRVRNDALGTVESCDPLELWQRAGKENGYNYLFALLSGLCATKIMSPYRSYAKIVSSGEAEADWSHARAFVKADQISKICKRIAEVDLKGKESVEIEDPDVDLLDMTIWLALRDVRKFVKAEWPSIVRIGDALLASPTKSLTYAECAEFLAER